ncbi:DNA invertase Pin-like site-specific DNA recombinase [Sphingobium sp. B7D2B]|uniref:recombinase family protein n=1 Tax=Sphingobium sp. B7D2B TaxID=2940583 RepID=UPI0022252088|nr:recombinase family protein [Sphingobium sp. B7D2B]MCW2365567.1 DNA invertase Pin-like site-specific DNA recombinase [Sphingobium sp. B7D2B]
MVKQSHEFPSATATKPAYLYARFSSQGQRDGHSIERQLGYGREFAEERGWAVVDELTDEAKSAFKGANREEGSALFGFEQKAREGHFQNGAVLVCENVDRLSRQGAKAAAKLIWALNDAGVDVATYHDGHVYKAGDDTDMMDLFSVIIKASVAHEESSKKSKRSNAGWSRIHTAIANGDKRAYSRQCPAWLDIKEEVYVPNHHRAALVRQIFDWYVNGIGSLTIIERLNSMGEKSWSAEKRYKDAKHWTPRYLHKLLTSRTVMGEYATLKGETLATDYYPQVIDSDTFHRAQLVRKDRTTIGGDERKRSANLLLGIVKCGECGYGAVLQKRTLTSKTRPPRTHSYLRCNDARYKATACTNRTILRYQVVEQTILHGMLPIIAANKRAKPALQNFDIQIADASRQLELLQTQLDNVIDAIAEGVSAKALASKAVALEAEIDHLNAHLATLISQRGMEASKPGRRDDLDAVEQLKEQLISADDEIQFEARMQVNTALKRLIDKIEIRANGTFIVWPHDDQFYAFDSDGAMLGDEHFE